MPSNSSLLCDRTQRINSVLSFNITTLRTLDFYGGYSTTATLSLIHDYTKAGVRKRMNSMVKGGWVRKVHHDEGLGRSEQIWCITKSGRIAAKTENDEFYDESACKGFTIADYRPSLAPHTALVQVAARKLTKLLGIDDVKPFKVEVRDRSQLRFIYPDIVFTFGEQIHGDKELTRYEFFEVELTIKSIKRYKDLLFRIALYNHRALLTNASFYIGSVIYITTRQLAPRLKKVLEKIPTNVEVHVFEYSDIEDATSIDFSDSCIPMDVIDEYQLEVRMR